MSVFSHLLRELLANKLSAMSALTAKTQKLPIKKGLKHSPDLDLWNSDVANPSDAIALSKEQLKEIDRRLDLLEEQSTRGTLWSVVRDRILAAL